MIKKRIKIENEKLKNDFQQNDFLIVDCIVMFLNYLKSTNKADSTIEAYKRDITQFMEFINSRKKYIREIISSDVCNFKDKLFNIGCDYSTVKRKIDALSSLLKFCTDRGWIRHNPCNGHRLKRTDSDEIRFLENEELCQLLNVFNEKNDVNWLRNTTILYALFNTAGRRTEVLDLRWKVVNFDTEIIVLNREKNQIIAELPMCSQFMELLKRMYAIECPDPDDFIFKGKGENRLSDTAYSSMIKKAVKMSGLTKDFNITGHCFRHSFAIYLIRAGVDIARVSKLLGHKDISTTVRYYYRIGKFIELDDRALINNMVAFCNTDTDK